MEGASAASAASEADKFDLFIQFPAAGEFGWLLPVLVASLLTGPAGANGVLVLGNGVSPLQR